MVAGSVPIKDQSGNFLPVFSAMRRSLADLLAIESVLRQATIELTYLLKHQR